MKLSFAIILACTIAHYVLPMDQRLITAIAGGDAGRVAELVAQPTIDINATDEAGNTALMRTIIGLHTFPDEQTSVLRKLLSAHPDLTARNNKQQTASILAVCHANRAALALLLAHGADPLERDSHGKTLKQLAQAMHKARLPHGFPEKSLHVARFLETREPK